MVTGAHESTVNGVYPNGATGGGGVGGKCPSWEGGGVVGAAWARVAGDGVNGGGGESVGSCHTVSSRGDTLVGGVLLGWEQNICVTLAQERAHVLVLTHVDLEVVQERFDAITCECPIREVIDVGIDQQ